MKILKKKQSGFTLLEMSIVLFIISLLVLIMLPNLSQQRKHANSIHGKSDDIRNSDPNRCIRK